MRASLMRQGLVLKSQEQASDTKRVTGETVFRQEPMRE